MSKSSTSFAKDKQPENGRGKAKKTLILNAIKKASLMGTNPDSTRDEAEEAFFVHVATQAANLTGEHFGLCLKILADKGWSSVKPTMEHVEFEFNAEATPANQAAQVMKAASHGLIAPDIANMFISSIASMLKIDEVTELQARLEAIEKVLGGNNG